jgi:hypothetical protein
MKVATGVNSVKAGSNIDNFVDTAMNIQVQGIY